MRARALIIGLMACCMTLINSGHAQSLEESLGFNVPCEGAIQPSCQTPLAQMNTGTCFIYVCNDNAPTGSDGQLCPVYSDCLANQVRTVTKDDNGCDKVICSANTGCVTADMVQCPAGQAVIDSGRLDEMRCPVFSCVGPETPVTPTTPAPFCPQQMACPPGYSKVDGPIGANGCKSFHCEAKVCPQIGNCPAGQTAKVSKGTDGCDKLECVKKQECPVQNNCPTGTKAVQLPSNDDGCQRFTCEKLDCPVQNNCPTGTKAEKKKNADGCEIITCVKTDVDPVVESGSEGECRAKSNSAGCSGAVACPRGQAVKKAKAACNLEYGTVSDADFEAVKFGKMRVIRASDNPSSGFCQAGNTTLQSGEQSLGSQFSDRVKFSCKEHDKNGGDCHIRVAVECEAATTNRWAIDSKKENVSTVVAGIYSGRLDETKLTEAQKSKLGVGGMTRCPYKDITSAIGQACADASATCFKFDMTDYRESNSRHSDINRAKGYYTIAKLKCAPSSGTRWVIASSKENIATRLTELQKSRLGIGGLSKCPFKDIASTIGQKCSGSSTSCYIFEQTEHRQDQISQNVANIGTAIYKMAKFSCK